MKQPLMRFEPTLKTRFFIPLLNLIVKCLSPSLNNSWSTVGMKAQFQLLFTYFLSF